MIPDRERTTGSLFERMEASSARNRQGGSIHSLRQSIRQNLRNILNTRSGSCRGAPELGIDEPEGAENFRESIPAEKLASIADMAPTTFYRHFKAFTSMTPLQYQKRLRLYEAQQFLLRGEGDVNSAAYAVGYQSPQQFNRDYKSLFGISPGKGVKARKSAVLEEPRL